MEKENLPEHRVSQSASESGRLKDSEPPNQHESNRTTLQLSVGVHESKPNHAAA